MKVSTAVALFVALAASPVWAQGQAGANRRLEGSWVRLDTQGAGSFGGLGAQIPPAQLTPAGAAARGGAPARAGGPGPARAGGPPAAALPNAPGVPYIVVERPCGFNPGRSNGALLVSPDSGGIHIVEGKDEVILAGERGGVRHIYMDGRPHPAAGRWTPTPAGHSIGRYDGNALLVDTVGFIPGAVPGGGQRSAETYLRERFEVSADGMRMTVTYTWDDPRIFVRPHTYTYTFDRLPDAYAFEDWCDASDPIERQSIVPPVQR